MFLGLIAGLLTILTLLLSGLYLYFKWRYTYWSRRNIPHTTPKLPLGDVKLDTNIGELFLDIYRKSSHEKMYGFWLLHTPILMVNDLDLIRKILVQDFQNFHSRAAYINEKDDPLTNHLFSMQGSKWKEVRSKLSPTFTSGKMKSMYPLVEAIAKRLDKVLDPIADVDGIIEARDVMGRYTTDVISSCIFGIETNSLEDPETMFRIMGRKIFEPTRSNMVRNALAFMTPEIAELIKMVQWDRDLSKFFRAAVSDTIDYRETNNVTRNDMMQILVELVKKKGADGKLIEGESLTMDEAAAQAFVFFIGGFETTSSTLQFTLYELAKNQDIQERLREEILQTLEETDGKITYEKMFQMDYLGRVIEETVRKYPAAAALMRRANNDYKVPGTNFTIEKGTSIFISAIGIQNDPKYYPDPEVFDPERFTEEAIAKRPKFTLITFGDGPRVCIGQRFAYMQMRIAVATIISKYKLEPCDKTPLKIKLDPKAFNLAPDGGLHLKITKI